MGRQRPGARQDTADRPFGFARNGADAKVQTQPAKSNPDLARGRRARVPPERFVPSLNWGNDSQHIGTSERTLLGLFSTIRLLGGYAACLGIGDPMRTTKVIRPAKVSLSGSTIFEGDALTTLRRLPSESIQTIVTSPPYWGLRDYDTDEQIGLEGTLPEFIASLQSVFREARRVLADDGVLWLNIGDGYTSGNRGWRAPDKKNPARAMSVRPNTPDGLKAKDLLGIPWRLAFALQDDGWYLRADIIWNKPNAMPESVRDRPTRAHEYIFMFTKSEKYYYDRSSVIEQNGRNIRSVWNIHTQGFSGAHFATFPTKLVEPCIKSSTKPGQYVLDPFFGSGTVGVVAQDLGREYVGIEINPSYVKLAAERLAEGESKIVRIAA